MKRSTVAAILSLIVPGSGLWYCGRRGLAVANFLLALGCLLIGFTTAFIADHILWVFLAIAAGSAGFAHAIGSQPQVPEHADSNQGQNV